MGDTASGCSRAFRQVIWFSGLARQLLDGCNGSSGALYDGCDSRRYSTSDVVRTWILLKANELVNLRVVIRTRANGGELPIDKQAWVCCYSSTWDKAVKIESYGPI